MGELVASSQYNTLESGSSRFTINGGIIKATSNSGRGITGGSGVYINGGIVTASGGDRAFGNSVHNSIAGTGWTNVAGTEGKAAIAVNTDPGQTLTYKKVQFPAVKDPAEVTKEPKANELTYTGSEQKLVTEGSASGGTMGYALGTDATTAPDATEFTASVPTGTDAKTYYVWYKAVGDSTHSDSKPECIPVTISEAGKLTVTFDVQGHGTAPKDQTVEKDSKVNKPEDPAAEGYTFGGWFKEKECKTAWEFDTDKVTENTTLFAKWTADDPSVTKYTVSFDVQEHGTAPEDQTVNEGNKANKPKDPTAEGYTFGGWFKEKECTNEWNFDSDKVTSNITLYAKWTENDKPEPTPTDTGVKLNVSEITIAQGRENALKATTVPEGASITWTSSDNSVAYVDAAGVVTGLKPGTATITAKITVDGKEYTASCKVTVVPTGSPIIFPTGGGEHTHKYVWDTIEATEDMDGELRYQCETCGDIKERVPLTAYNVFNKNTTEKIRNAKKDATLKIETNKWISFHKMVMEALAERPDVTLEISFLDEGHKGNRCTVVIPKGTDTMSFVDKNGFTGFLFLGGKFGMKTN